MAMHRQLKTMHVAVLKHPLCSNFNLTPAKLAYEINIIYWWVY